MQPNENTGKRLSKINKTSEGLVTMQAKQKQNTLQYQQSVGNLALAVQSLQFVQKPNGNGLSSATLPLPIQGIMGNDLEDEDISPARGIFGAIGLSVILWWLIIFIFYWIYFSLKQTRL